MATRIYRPNDISISTDAVDYGGGSVQTGTLRFTGGSGETTLTTGEKDDISDGNDSTGYQAVAETAAGGVRLHYAVEETPDSVRVLSRSTDGSASTGTVVYIWDGSAWELLGSDDTDPFVVDETVGAGYKDGNGLVSVAIENGSSIGILPLIRNTFIEVTYTEASEPDAPTNLTADAQSDTEINLDWDAPLDDGGSAITGYKIERESPTGGGFSILVADTGTTATTYGDSGLTAGTQYNYRVSAINSVGTSTPSNEAADTTWDVPDAPTNLTATAASTTQIDLSWTAPASDNGSAVAGYKIERESPTGGGFSTVVADTGTTATTYSDSPLSSATEYNYRVSAINSVGTSDPSNADAATTIPQAPSDLAATGGNEQIDLTWDASPDDDGSAVDHYSVKRSTTQGSGHAEIDTVAADGSATYDYTDPSVTVGTTYYYVVTAVAGSTESANSNEDSAEAFATPDAPTGLTATADGYTAVDLAWTAPANDGGSPITGYRIDRLLPLLQGAQWNVHVADTGSTETTYRDTDVDADTTYHYRVYAINAVGLGDVSNTDFVTTEPEIDWAHEALRYALTQDGDVTDLVDEANIVPFQLWHSDSRPAITYQVISRQHRYSYDGNLSAITDRIQYNVWANSYDTAHEIVNAVRHSLNSYTATHGVVYIHRSRIDDVSDTPTPDPQPGEETPIYGVMMDVIVSWETTT